MGPGQNVRDTTFTLETNTKVIQPSSDFMLPMFTNRFSRFVFSQLHMRSLQCRGSSDKASLTHLDDKGRARMVDISNKPVTRRTAHASAIVELGVEIYNKVSETVDGDKNWKKGDILTVAELAGIQAAKQTSAIIPLCHSVQLSHVGVTASLCPPDRIDIAASAVTAGGTGVEMEALTAASVAALTIYDMCKAAGKGIVIRDIRLESKTGGRSGDFHRESAPHSINDQS